MRNRAEPTIYPTGTCFDDALDYIGLRLAEDRHSEKKLLLVHGICLVPPGHQQAGQQFAHAWVEEGELVWQDGLLGGKQRVTYSVARLEFYAELRVQKFTAYTPREAWVENRRTAHYGPWVEEYRALCGGGTVFWPEEG